MKPSGWMKPVFQPTNAFTPISVKLRKFSNFKRRDLKIFLVFLNRSSAFWTEGVVCIALSCLVFPANIFAIYKFYQTKINRIFFALIAAFCITNIFYASISLMNGIATFGDHPLGWFGCAMSSCGGCISLNIAMAIQTLISYERRKVITSVTLAKFSSRVYILLAMSTVGLTGFWILMYSVLIEFRYVPIHLTPNSTEIANVCIAASRIFPGFLELIFAFCQLVIPGAIIIRNYW